MEKNCKNPKKLHFLGREAAKNMQFRGRMTKKNFVVIIQPLSSLLVKKFRPEDFPVLNWEFFCELFRAKTLPPEN